MKTTYDEVCQLKYNELQYLWLFFEKGNVDFVCNYRLGSYLLRILDNGEHKYAFEFDKEGKLIQGF